jgi:hypothetical protein
MTNETLGNIFTKTADSVHGTNGRWQFTIKDVLFICLTDSTHNRMRIISPIMETFQLSNELQTLALSANFHTALDVKYAISDNVLWSAFIHPLRELSEDQVEDAISQVYYGNINFGTTFSSTSLVFPGNQREKEPDKKEDILKQKF